MNLYVIALIAIAAYLVVVAAGRRLGLWKRFDVTFYGPVLMLKTRMGRGLIDSIAARRRFWKAYGTVSVIVTFATTIVFTLLFLVAIYLASQGRTLPSASISEIGQPGVSPIAFVVFAVIGFGIAVLFHELVHGVLSVIAKIKVESMGILLLLVPIGAFVEPNDKELKKAPRSARLRLFSAGPATNLFVGVVVMAVLVGFVAPAATSTSEGAVVTSVAPGSPAEVSGIATWSRITGVGGEPIRDSSDFRNVSFVTPGSLISINFTRGGQDTVIALPGGVVVTSTTEGPAVNAAIAPGMIVRSLNGTVIHSVADLESTVANASRQIPVNISVMKLGFDRTAGMSWFVEDQSIRSVNLTSKWLYYYTHYPSLNRPEYKNISYLGIAVAPFGILVDDTENILQPITHPFAGVNDPKGFAEASFAYISLPFKGYAPLMPPTTDLSGPSGILSFMPQQAYWTLANLLYWIFWANIMLGITNTLPALPLDGGLVIRDLLKGVAHRAGERLTGFDLAIGRRPLAEKRIDQLMIVVTGLVVLGFFYLLLGQFIGPF